MSETTLITELTVKDLIAIISLNNTILLGFVSLCIALWFLYKTIRHFFIVSEKKKSVE